MVYIKDEWFVDKSNETRIRELIEELKAGIRFEDHRPDEEVLADIESLGEHKILELLQQNRI